MERASISGWAFAALCGLAAASVAMGQEAEEAVGDESERRGAEHLVVLRLSSGMLNSLLGGKEIDRHVPVNDVVLGTAVSGVARIVGQPRVDLVPSEDEARFSMVISGTVYSKTVGRNGPAIIDGHSITHFTATKPIVLEPGTGFYGQAATVSARTECVTDRVRSTRGGLIGRIVTRQAWRRIGEQHEEVEAIARDRATRRIAAAVEQQMNERLARLNRFVEMRTMVARLRDREEDTRLVCRTTPYCVEIANGGDGSSKSIELPALAAASPSGTTMEVWIHGSVVPPNLSKAAQLLFATPQENSVLDALARLPGTLGKDAAAAIHAVVSEDAVAVRNQGEWVVVEVNTAPSSRYVASRAIRR